MKKIMLFLAVALMAFACGNENKEGVVCKITGVVPNNIDSDSLFLYLYPNEEPTLGISTADTSILFEVNIQEPTIGQISDEKNRTLYAFLVEEGEIQLDNVKHNAYGAVLNDTYNQWSSDIKAIVTQTDNLDSLTKKVQVYFDANFAQVSNSIVGVAILLQNIEVLGYQATEKHLSMLSAEMQKNEIVTKIREAVEDIKKTAEGMEAPDVQVYSIVGEPLNLSKYIEPTQYTLIDCWASWCPDCIKSIPTLKEISKNYPDLNIVGISLDRNPQKAMDAIVKEGISWKTCIDANKEFGTVYSIHWIPEFIIINPQGIIIKRSYDVNDIVNFLKSQGC